MNLVDMIAIVHACWNWNGSRSMKGCHGSLKRFDHSGNIFLVVHLVHVHGHEIQYHCLGHVRWMSTLEAAGVVEGRRSLHSFCADHRFGQRVFSVTPSDDAQRSYLALF